MAMPHAAASTCTNLCTHTEARAQRNACMQEPHRRALTPRLTTYQCHHCSQHCGRKQLRGPQQPNSAWTLSRFFYTKSCSRNMQSLLQNHTQEAPQHTHTHTSCVCGWGSTAWPRHCDRGHATTQLLHVHLRCFDHARMQAGQKENKPASQPATAAAA